MKKIILTTFLLVTFVLTGFAQSLQLSHNQVDLANGEELNIYGDSSNSTTIYAHIDVRNTTTADVDIKVKKVELSLVSGSENFFCWGQCYTPATYVSPVSVTVASKATSTGFDGEYMPKGNLGTSKVMYVFFVDGNANDSAAVIVNYVATPVGIDSENFQVELSDAFPNPAHDKVSFKYELPAEVSSAKVIIRNMIGSVVREAALSKQNKEVSINTADLNEGVYFYSFLLDDKIYVTKKLVIQHR